MELAAVIIAGVAALIALATAIYARGQRQAAVRSASAAEVSAKAAEDSADAAKKALAIEQARRRDEEEAARTEQRRAMANRVRWHFARGGGDKYRLTNTGNEPAFDVRAELGGLGAIGDQTSWDQINSGDSVQFFAATSFNSPDYFTLRWRYDGDSETQQKRIDL